MDRYPVLAASSPRGLGRPAADRWARCETCRWRGRPAAPPPRRTCGPIRSEHLVTWPGTANHLSAAGLNLKPGCTTMAATLYVSLGNRSWASYDSATGIRGIIYSISSKVTPLSLLHRTDISRSRYTFLYILCSFINYKINVFVICIKNDLICYLSVFNIQIKKIV